MLANIEEWNQYHFEDDINENFVTGAEIETGDDLKMESSVKKHDTNETVAIFNRA